MVPCEGFKSNVLTWEDDTLHPGISLEKLGGSHCVLEVPLHPYV